MLEPPLVFLNDVAVWLPDGACRVKALFSAVDMVWMGFGAGNGAFEGVSAAGARTISGAHMGEDG